MGRVPKNIMPVLILTFKRHGGEVSDGKTLLQYCPIKYQQLYSHFLNTLFSNEKTSKQTKNRIQVNQRFIYSGQTHKTKQIMKNCCIYARVSSTNERQNTERQVADLTNYAEYQGMEVLKIFEEHISGAKSNDERKVFMECMEYCIESKTMLLVSELSRVGRSPFEVLMSVKLFLDAGINIYFQKEQFSLLDDEGKPSMFAPIMIATLSTCAMLERENIQYRLNSGRQLYIEKGGRLGRKVGSVKPRETKEVEYKQVIKELRKGTSIRRTAKLCDVSVSTVQRVKAEFIE